MTECIDIGSYIVTIVVMTHGNVIELNISPEKQKVFQNVIYLSLAGEFIETGLGLDWVRNNHLTNLDKMFQRDLNNTINVMQSAADRIRPAYMNYMKMFFGQSAENSCKIFNNVQYDKAFGKGIEGILDRMLQCILPDVFGIFVISVHKKINETTLKLIYPVNNTQPKLDLLKHGDLIQFVEIFNTDGNINTDGNTIINKLIKESTPWRPIADISPTDENQIKQIQDWKVTTSDSGDISHIRLSYLIDTIKTIVGHDKCKMNIIDYSCSPISHFVSDKERSFARYTQSMDIENAIPESGGKNARKKRRTNRRCAKKRYTKKRHRKNKTSNNPIQKKQHKNT